MTTTLHRLEIAGNASLAPWLALLVAAEIADDGPASVRVPGAGLLYLGFVALPCVLRWRRRARSPPGSPCSWS